jgi:IBR domain, a half RING-finger domain
MEIIGSKANLRAPCGHFYDEKCLVSLIQRASMDESSFPPRCCRQAIPRDSFIPFIAREVREIFEKASNEFSTRPRDRVYCSNATCSEFLGAGSTGSTSRRTMACPECDRSTCSVCRGPAHPSSTACRQDEGTGAIQSLMEENKWQRCPECHRVVELTYGCFHITCVCRAQFCYQCSGTWKTCKCLQWDERLLLAEAERRVDAEIESGFGLGIPPAPNPIQDDLLHPRTSGEAQETTDGARLNRIAEVATRLRTNHACNHNWQRRAGAGECAHCNAHYRRFLLVSGHVLISAQSNPELPL